MGRLEKIVVVTVLFLVAVILGVSLNSDPDTGTDGAKPAGPVREGAARGRRNQEVKEGAAQDGSQAQNAGATDNANGLLSTSIGTTGTPAPSTNNGAGTTPPAVTPNGAGAAPVNPGAQPAAPGSFLATRDGLEATQSEDWMLYTWKAGDTFKALAKRYYGSEVHVGRLRTANEGRDETQIAAGDKILVAAKSASVPAVATPKAGDAKSADAKNAPQNTWAGGLYEVKSGDVLGTISQTVYGTSKSWKKIYDANRDVIGDNPNTLKVGTKLRIPE